MRVYQALNNQVLERGDYKLVPIRHEDRYKIMQWRNGVMSRFIINVKWKPLPRKNEIFT